MADRFPIRRIDHIELYVGNARQAAVFYEHGFGFPVTAYRGLETGCRETTSYVLECGAIRFVLTSGLAPDGTAARFAHAHGDGVAVVALEVPDAARAFAEAHCRGAAGAATPVEERDEHGLLRSAAIHAYGDTVIKFVERPGYHGVFAPGFEPRGSPGLPARDVGLTAIDHVVANVERGQMERWVRFFAETMGLTELLHFDDEAISWYRYAHGDELIFVHAGAGVLESQFGSLRYRPHDYLVIPTGVLWRILPDDGSDQRMLVVESDGGHVEPPGRYLNRHGQFVESAPYGERDIRPPDALDTHDEPGTFEVRVKARGQVTRYLYARHPLDVVGWDGHLWPYAFNIEDFEPITGRVHQPPPVHQTFEGPGFVVCSFVPRLFDYHPLAIPAPYNHSNVDSDEVIYYVAGDFMSRRGTEPAAFTVHPNGIPHGPHPGAYEGSIGKDRTDELAVMIDTFRPLRLTADAAGPRGRDVRQ